MASISRTSAFARVTALAAKLSTHAAFAWLHGNPKKIMDWHAAVVGIPAPSFGEQERAQWMLERFCEAGLADVRTDEIGNVCGFIYPANHHPESSGPVVMLSAHLDTVFPAGTPVRPSRSERDGVDRLEAPGACDNGAGLAGLLALAYAMLHARVDVGVSLLLVANVGEEGEGDLRGVRHLYAGSLGGRIAAHIVLDGAGADSAVTQALGSRRFQVTISGPGGHSFTDAGTPNPIAALANALAVFSKTPVPDEPRTTMNLGTIHGGTSVNSIPENATATIDFRSTNSDELLRLEVTLHRAVEDAVESANVRSKSSGARRKLVFAITKIGDRPAAQLPAESPVLETLQAVDRLLNLKTTARLGSTDANIPLSMHIPAVSIGAGGDGGGAHTMSEWYAAKDRELGLKRALLLTLAMLEWAAEI